MVTACHDRVSELLVSITCPKDQSVTSNMANFMDLNTDRTHKFKSVWREDQASPNFDNLVYARTLFDLKELKKCAFVLKGYEANLSCQSSFFLYNYSLYLAGYQRKEEEIFERQKSKVYAGQKVSESAIINNQAKNLRQNFDRFYENNELDDLNTYLYGLILAELGNYELAIKAFVKALNINPCFWSAWLELSRIINLDEVKADSFEILGKIKDHWMKNFFLAGLMLEKVKMVEIYDKYCLDLLIGLQYFFKTSSYLISQSAQLFYNKKDHDLSVQMFQEVIRIDPYRLENLDIYSNILYVKDNPKDLGALAYNSFMNNKYSPETNCIIGNYHSLMGEHEKAISYFKNALNLDRTFLAAWTLIGHEYLELKRVPNAIDAYNHAIKIDNKDFRAWYGLGQAYELQTLLQSSIHYFLMAVKTRPRDFRMWNALATVYTKIDKQQEAIKCSERAENYKDDERIALFSLGKLYDSLGMTEKAVHYFTENLNRIDNCSTIESVFLLYSRT